MAKLTASLLLFFGIVAGLGVTGVVSHIRFTPPTQEAISQPVWIPDGAEVRPGKVVQPGTFKISIPLEELQNTTQPGKPMLVVFKEQDPIPTGGSSPSIAYYRPTQDGSGIFHYAKVVIPLPHEDLPFHESVFTKWKVSFDEQNRAFQFTRVKDIGPLFLSSVVAVLGGMLFLFFIGVTLHRMRRRSAPVTSP